MLQQVQLPMIAIKPSPSIDECLEKALLSHFARMPPDFPLGFLTKKKKKSHV